MINENELDFQIVIKYVCINYFYDMGFKIFIVLLILF